MARRPAAVSDRWAARPLLGGALRLLALLGPVLVGLLTALGVSRALPAPSVAEGRIAWWATVLLTSAAAVFAADRLARRLLPLAVLLELSLIFPDRAPSRLRAARTSSVRDLDARLARLRGDGVPMEPFEAAETVVVMVGILGLHDKRTRGHSERVRAFTDLLTAELGLDESARVRLRWAALVHDIGKLTVPTAVLNGAGRLDDEGWELIHRHPEEGVRLLGGLLPWLGEWGDAVLEHHERFDGTGYPRGLAGHDISYAARIVALADSFEVMTSARSYNSPRSAAWARGELTRCAGTQFDPALVRAFLQISLGRLRWVLGPVTWLAELPFVATADRAGQTVKVAAVGVLAAGLLGTGLLPAPGPADAAPGRVVAADPDRSTVVRPPAPTPTRRASPPAPPPSAVPASARPAQTADSRQQVGSGATPGVTDRRTPVTGTPASAPRPSPAGRTAPSEPVRVYHLTGDGLSERPPARAESVTLARGGSVRFDARLDRTLELPRQRDLVLYAAFDSRQGSAKLDVRLLDCPGRSSTGCDELVSRVVPQEKSTRTERYVIALPSTGTQTETLPAGRVLRLQVTLLEPGAKGAVRLLLGPPATPSQLRLDPPQ